MPSSSQSDLSSNYSEEMFSAVRSVRDWATMAQLQMEEGDPPEAVLEAIRKIFDNTSELLEAFRDYLELS